ncbi:hypothetical protein AAFF_G00153620 [Aldrovandia affinis]|uniref:Uncharacterized protein n=1 Tax=Aldrovandia affinis TaxID=143900 RepID=A0AAD7SZN4_9TELE|nr:hypothetical protein AAFF_G00153620 [Aldrovandia affinis]
MAPDTPGATRLNVSLGSTGEALHQHFIWLPAREALVSSLERRGEATLAVQLCARKSSFSAAIPQCRPAWESVAEPHTCWVICHYSGVSAQLSPPNHPSPPPPSSSKNTPSIPDTAPITSLHITITPPPSEPHHSLLGEARWRAGSWAERLSCITTRHRGTCGNYRSDKSLQRRHH